MAGRTSWRRHLQRARTVGRLGASAEAKSIEARLQAQLPGQVWDEVEAEWQAKDDREAYLPQQRRDFLIEVASRHGVSLAGISGGW